MLAYFVIGLEYINRKDAGIPSPLERFIVYHMPLDKNGLSQGD